MSNESVHKAIETALKRLGKADEIRISRFMSN